MRLEPAGVSIEVNMLWASESLLRQREAVASQRPQPCHIGDDLDDPLVV